AGWRRFLRQSGAWRPMWRARWVLLRPLLHGLAPPHTVWAEALLHRLGKALDVCQPRRRGARDAAEKLWQVFEADVLGRHGRDGNRAGRRKRYPWSQAVLRK